MHCPWLRRASLVGLLTLACGLLPAQRFIPPDRAGPLANPHLKVKPPNLRGTYFTLARNETIETF